MWLKDICVSIVKLKTINYKMRSFLLFTSMIISTSIHGQLKKIQTKTANDMISEIYYVLKKDQQVKEGEYIQLFNDAKIIQGQYKNNQKTGKWHYYDISGKLNFSGPFENDVKTGQWVYLYDNKIASQLFYNNGRTDSINGYHSNGQIAYEVRYNYDETGYCKSYYPNGQVRESFSLKNNEIHDIYKYYFANGQLHRETEYNEGKPISALRTMDPHGKDINGGTLNEGYGTYIAYHISDSIDSLPLNIYVVKNYENGRLNGNCEYFQKNGNKITQGMFKDGYRTGEWKLFNEDGSFKTSVNYDNDSYVAIQKREADVFFIGNEMEKISIMPEFQGGEEKRFDFMIKNLQYPKKARANSIEGTVYINFIITVTGELESFKIIKGVDDLLDDEVIRFTKLMPRWSPGLEHGIPVRVSFNMPVKFRLQ